MLVCSLTRKLTENTSHWNRTQSSHLNSDTNLHETALDQFLLYRTWSSSTLYFPPYFQSISYKPDPHPTAAVSVGPLFRVRSEQDLLESSPTFPYLVRPRVNHRSNLGFYWLSSQPYLKHLHFKFNLNPTKRFLPEWKVRFIVPPLSELRQDLTRVQAFVT